MMNTSDREAIVRAALHLALVEREDPHAHSDADMELAEERLDRAVANVHPGFRSVYFVFKPDEEKGQSHLEFIEVEDENGSGVRIGEWLGRDERGYSRLKVMVAHQIEEGMHQHTQPGGGVIFHDHDGEPGHGHVVLHLPDARKVYR